MGKRDEIKLGLELGLGWEKTGRGGRGVVGRRVRWMGRLKWGDIVWWGKVSGDWDGGKGGDWKTGEGRGSGWIGKRNEKGRQNRGRRGSRLGLGGFWGVGLKLVGKVMANWVGKDCERICLWYVEGNVDDRAGSQEGCVSFLVMALVGELGY
jgi:hypothetical protein